MKLPIISHLEKLKDQAIEENKKLHNDFRKYQEYYEGSYKGCNNQLNIIKGIVDTKTTLILDFEAVSSVVPRTKSFANINQVSVMNSIADILNDCNTHILKVNDFDTVKREVVENYNKCGLGIIQTSWKQADENELGEVEIISIDPLNFFPDTTAEKIDDCNYIFKKEIVSSITLKKDYPQYAERIENAKSVGKETTKNDNENPSGAINTVKNEFNTTQMYADGEAPSASISQSKNIVVWNCYLKDDSTFIDTKDTEKQELMFQYPNGRFLRWVEGAEDYLLEDKPIDVPTGYPFDIIKGSSSVKYLIETQNRIDKAYKKIRMLIGGYVSFLAHTPDCDITDQEIIDQLTIEVDALGQMEIITNNTLDRLKSLIEYIQMLKEQAYEIARINPSLISGKRQDGVDSGRMVAMLNESPMTAISETQKLVKSLIIKQGNKNIILCQMYYNVPRIIRLTGGDLAYLQPEIKQVGPDGEPIQIAPEIKIYQESATKELEAIKTIQADLSLGEYDIDIVAGAQMPRSRAEKANIYMQLAQMNKIPDTPKGTELLLNALDIPDKTGIMQAIQEAQEQAMANRPQITIEPEILAKIFKDMPLETQLQALAQYGFQVPTVAQEIEVKQMVG